MPNKIPIILIASLIRDRGWILPEFLTHLDNINYPKDKIKLFFIINNSTDSSKEILANWDFSFYNNCTIIEENFNNLKPDARGKSRRHIYTALTKLRNKVLSYFKYSKCDYLFTIDSDILVKPDILKELLSFNTEAASAVIYNDYGRGEIGNCMNFTNERAKHIKLEDVSNTFEADLSGAVTLYTREIINKNFKYKVSNKGEDYLFCKQLNEKGINFMCKKGLATHIMTKERLKEYKNGKRKEI